MKVFIVLLILIAIAILPLFACLVVASDYDDAMGYDDVNEVEDEHNKTH